MSALLWAVRQFFMPNPFEALGEGLEVVLNEVPILLTPDILNWIAGLGLPAFTFLIVGLYYVGGSAPVAGSLLYMFFFCVHTGILHLMCLAYPVTWLIVLIAVAYIGIHLLALSIKRRVDFIWTRPIPIIKRVSALFIMPSKLRLFFLWWCYQVVDDGELIACGYQSSSW